MRYEEHSARNIRKSVPDSRRLNFTNLIQALKNDMTFLVCIRIVQEVITVFLCHILTIVRAKHLFVSRFIRSRWPYSSFITYKNAKRNETFAVRFVL